MSASGFHMLMHTHVYLLVNGYLGYFYSGPLSVMLKFHVFILGAQLLCHMVTMFSILKNLADCFL